MHLSSLFKNVILLGAVASATSTQGLYDLVERRLPGHCEDFVFTLHPETNSSAVINDAYSISSENGSIAIQGTSLSALATGLRRYFTDVAHADVYWFIGNQLEEAISPLPRPNGTISGKSIVPWRYYFNTVTFSYTSPFWSWDDWELELDWLALHGVNLPLAWVGFEKILLDVFRDVNLTGSEILPFFSGPAFQAWNRFGNTQGSWGGELPLSWIDSQFELQRKIIERMLALGMTPILPAFTGFVPRAIADVYPNASIVNGSRWEEFPIEYTNTTFLEPTDPLFPDLQNRVIKKQIEYYGDITSFYTLDQYNENDPYSGDLDYLRNSTNGIWKSLKSADADAVWVMQGWLFYSSIDFWTNERIEAYLSGVEVDSDMLVLDLFSESQPQWQRTDSYYGKPWVWCELHDYGGNMGLYGQIDNVTINPVAALANSSSMIGMGITPEGQEGNEIMYALLLDQAWSSEPIDTDQYFRDWTRNRYANGSAEVPEQLYTAWELLRKSAYNNTNLTSNAVPKAIFELAPNITGLVNRTGHHPTAIYYNPDAIVQAWEQMYAAAQESSSLWDLPGFQHDFVDVTRQVFANSFLADYETFISLCNSTSSSTPNSTNLTSQAARLTSTLSTLDSLLSTLPQFSLSTWISQAQSWAHNNTQNSTSDITDYYPYNAINQITLWGPSGEILDYASKSWGGLVRYYYLPRWEAFLNYVVQTGPNEYNATEVRAKVKAVEDGFQGFDVSSLKQASGDVSEVVERNVVPMLQELGLL